MPVTPTYPGVYVQEVPSGVRTIVGVPTSVTAFVGAADRGPANQPITINNFGDFARQFGGLSRSSRMSYAVAQFFQAGGARAIAVRVIDNSAAAATASIDGTDAGTSISLAAANEGLWGDNLRVIAQTGNATADPTDATLLNLIVREFETGADRDNDPPVREEVFRNVSTNSASPRFVTNIVNEQSNLVRVTALDAAAGVGAATEDFTNGADSGTIGTSQVTDPAAGSGDGNHAEKRGIYALRDADVFNLLVIPPYSETTHPNATDWGHAAKFCKDERAFLLVDPDPTWDRSDMLTEVVNLRGDNSDHAAVYFPCIRMSDPLRDNELDSFPPSGLVAGIIARTDAQRGVWKAPAGLEASLSGVSELAVRLTDAENGELNPQGINCLRSLPGLGRVVWGARTIEGADILASEWKYLPVRRLALYIEESLFRGTQWVVFEPNDEPLWAQIRLNVGAFMQNLFRQGAFQGSKPSEAYFVKCDAETTTQADIDQGIVNIHVGFAPLKPAEFVIISIQQISNLEVG